MTSGRRAGCATAMCSRCWRAPAGGAGASCGARRRCSPPRASCCSTAATACACSASCSSPPRGQRPRRWCCCTAGRAAPTRSTCCRWRSCCSTRGFDVVRLNLRDHGETHHLNRDLFHSCRLPEVVGAVRALQQCFRAGRCTWSASRSAATSCCGWRRRRGAAQLRARQGDRGLAGARSGRDAGGAGERHSRLPALLRAQVAALAAQEAGRVAGRLRLRPSSRAGAT